jgi:hypothetical protein
LAAFVAATPVVVPLPMIEEIKTPPHGAAVLAVTTTPDEIGPIAMLPAAKLKVVPAITTLAGPKGTLALGEMTNPTNDPVEPGVTEAWFAVIPATVMLLAAIVAAGRP